jgi:predicted dehydrogenase
MLSKAKKSATHPIRYAVVGLGHIAQVAILPAFRHASRNTRLVAVVSDDATKRRIVSKKYGVAAYTYADYEACLEEVDAVFIALPNSLHAEYTVRAAQAGVHVLCEKPMAVTADDCERMIAACRQHAVKLMIAYRLHFEAITLEVLAQVRRGRIGEPKFFNASFSLRVRPGNIRTQKAMGGGSLYDIGVYCINAARAVFGSEPKEVMALSVNSGPAALREIDESTGALLRFDGERVAAFVTSFNAADVGTYRIVGTKGDIHVNPAYEYVDGLRYEMTVNGKKTRVRGKKVDQFAAECCISRIASGTGSNRSPPAKKGCRTCASSRPCTSPPTRARPWRFRRSLGESGRRNGSDSADRRSANQSWSA